jgi:spore coat polysaccharide biosynthesis predicted glycosyltransferase SpsG
MGFGHLVRTRTVAAALGVPPVVSLRGSRAAVAAASKLGVSLTGSLAAVLRASRPTLLIVDDPCPAAAARSIRTAERLSVATASIHDLGLAPCESDLSIDGSIEPGPMDLAGVRFALLHPRLRRLAALRRDRRGRPTVVVAFGGGSRQHFAAKVVREIQRRRPGVRIRVAGGFCSRPKGRLRGLATPVDPREFHKALAGATAAVLAGGVTLYEACVLGVPAIGISVAPGQRRAVAGLARRGAVIDGGHIALAPRTAARAAQLLDDLLDRPDRRRRLAQTAQQLVDGQGAARVAAALRSVALVSSGRRLAS